MESTVATWLIVHLNLEQKDRVTMAATAQTVLEQAEVLSLQWAAA